MKTKKPIRSETIRLRLTKEERQLIDVINNSDFTNISEHVRRSLFYYASNYYPTLLKNKIYKYEV